MDKYNEIVNFFKSKTNNLNYLQISLETDKSLCKKEGVLIYLGDSTNAISIFNNIKSDYANWSTNSHISLKKNLDKSIQGCLEVFLYLSIPSRDKEYSLLLTQQIQI